MNHRPPWSRQVRKRGHFFTSWRRRWLVVAGAKVTYYVDAGLEDFGGLNPTLAAIDAEREAAAAAAAEAARLEKIASDAAAAAAAAEAEAAHRASLVEKEARSSLLSRAVGRSVRSASVDRTPLPPMSPKAAGAGAGAPGLPRPSFSPSQAAAIVPPPLPPPRIALPPPPPGRPMSQRITGLFGGGGGGGGGGGSGEVTSSGSAPPAQPADHSHHHHPESSAMRRLSVSLEKGLVKGINRVMGAKKGKAGRKGAGSNAVAAAAADGGLDPLSAAAIAELIEEEEDSYVDLDEGVEYVREPAYKQMLPEIIRAQVRPVGGGRGGRDFKLPSTVEERPLLRRCLASAALAGRRCCVAEALRVCWGHVGQPWEGSVGGRRCPLPAAPACKEGEQDSPGTGGGGQQGRSCCEFCGRQQRRGCGRVVAGGQASEAPWAASEQAAAEASAPRRVVAWRVLAVLACCARCSCRSWGAWVASQCCSI